MKHGLVRLVGAFAILVACGCGSRSPTADASGAAGSSSAGSSASGAGGTTGAAGTSSTGGAGTSGSAGGGGAGACVTDSDCMFNAGADCCGVCLAKTDKVPPPLPCIVQCPVRPPACVCENHRCAIGTLKPGDTCNPGHDLCGYSVCCQVCSPIPQPDGGGCAPPTCTDAFPGKDRICLQPP